MPAIIATFQHLTECGARADIQMRESGKLPTSTSKDTPVSQRTLSRRPPEADVPPVEPVKVKKPAAEVSERCGACRYFLATAAHPIGFFSTISKGECRRFPPAYLGRRGAMGHPTVIETGWCGEYKKRPA
jgi:hypothetical protein